MPHITGDEIEVPYENVRVPLLPMTCSPSHTTSGLIRPSYDPPREEKNITSRLFPCFEYMVATEPTVMMLSASAGTAIVLSISSPELPAAQHTTIPFEAAIDAVRDTRRVRPLYSYGGILP